MPSATESGSPPPAPASRHGRADRRILPRPDRVSRVECQRRHRTVQRLRRGEHHHGARLHRGSRRRHHRQPGDPDHQQQHADGQPRSGRLPGDADELHQQREPGRDQRRAGAGHGRAELPEPEGGPARILPGRASLHGRHRRELRGRRQRSAGQHLDQQPRRRHRELRRSRPRREPVLGPGHRHASTDCSRAALPSSSGCPRSAAAARSLPGATPATRTAPREPTSPST